MTAIGAIDLVDHHDGPETQRQRLASHEFGLRHGAFGTVDQQNHAVDHGQDAFHLGTEIGVAGRIDDIDPVTVPFDAGAFGEDGDPAFLFQVVRIHRAFFHALIVAEGAGLAEQLIHQCGLAVVDVSDDRHVAQIFGAQGGTCGHTRGDFQFEEIGLSRIARWPRPSRIAAMRQVFQLLIGCGARFYVLRE